MFGTISYLGTISDVALYCNRRDSKPQIAENENCTKIVNLLFIFTIYCSFLVIVKFLEETISYVIFVPPPLLLIAL